MSAYAEMELKDVRRQLTDLHAAIRALPRYELSGNRMFLLSDEARAAYPTIGVVAWEALSGLLVDHHEPGKRDKGFSLSSDFVAAEAPVSAPPDTRPGIWSNTTICIHCGEPFRAHYGVDCVDGGSFQPAGAPPDHQE